VGREGEHDGAEPEADQPSLGRTEMEARYNRYAESTDRFGKVKADANLYVPRTGEGAGVYVDCTENVG
jgi:hypothetical protein